MSKFLKIMIDRSVLYVRLLFGRWKIFKLSNFHFSAKKTPAGNNP